MSTITEIDNFIESADFNQLCYQLYGNKNSGSQAKRYSGLVRNYSRYFDSNDISIFSTPGRTEIGGNHTDHNHGCVLAASVNLDSIAAAAPTADNIIKLYSQGFTKPFIVDISDLNAREDEKETTEGLIRGLAAGFKKHGYQTGGFTGYLTSDVLIGSGLSSSASIEVLIATILNTFYNDNAISPLTLAQISQFAENKYFGKPCGLMDQTACAVGGIISIDFEKPEKPLVTKVNFDFTAKGYALIVLDTGGNHADLTEDYASIPEEMKSVAARLNAPVLRQITRSQLLNALPELRNSTGDRAILRALHFAADNQRVGLQVRALEANDFTNFLHLVNESGDSSFKWLQNIYSTKNPAEQGVTLALALTELFLTDISAGACRVHGGGFAGTIQVFLPLKSVADYCRLIEPVFGKKSVLKLSIRQTGTICLPVK